ncbi:hypothetical protein QBC46DRAFT_457884 [Diplogelasinospora grovesii]|uniref:Uncharacterized protein n=1 Tax=Diplogelasinospora grovesii TaxID=303347 RepID=A0AAN6NBP5_9PEZI|nr:hypothetical protein QBC46DRAFT_457884 [Diplogelasinospora grovesii]
MVNKSILASVSVSGQFAKPSVSPTDGASAAQNPDAYTFFKGDGSKGAGWPTQDQWINFNDMFDRNSKVMGQGCTAGVTPTTTDEIDTIKSAIQSVASAAAIDPRFVLATVMQESNGCVRVPGTPSGEAGVFNPGLMQSFKGTGTCNVNNTQQINPCPPDQITQMIVDGTQGVNTPDASGKDALQGGLVQQINAQTTADANGQIYYKAARAYNSGAISADGVLETAGQCGPPRTFGVPCYSSDIANRMMGWVSAPTGCDLKPAASC